MEATGITFPEKHPQPGFAYAVHPCRPASYLLLADFHPRLFEEKFSELLRILTSIGAIKIEVAGGEGWGWEITEQFSLGVLVPLAPDNSTSASAAEGSRRSEAGHRGILYAASLPQNASQLLPSGLIWYYEEASWRELVRQRFENSLRDFRLALTYRTDFGVTTYSAGSVMDAGLKIGEGFIAKTDTTWTLAGRFAVLNA